MNDYLIEKVEEVLNLNRGEHKYIKECYNDEINSSFMIDGKEILFPSKENEKLIKSMNNNTRFKIFNPIKYDSHLQLLIDEIKKYDKNYLIYTFKGEGDNLYHSNIIFHDEETDIDELMFSNEFGYVKRNKSILVAILNILSTSFDEIECENYKDEN